MRIKKLEIQGFKSFADRTVIEFQQGITGVVGPNGCGKSNVVDSIRWVMGEMSAKHLRGSQMQDVIFSGSEKRSPSNFAEVTMTLSNEDGRAPSAYSHFTEISITRRLFRSGESEYFINKTPSRLRDIYDLFLGTGVGTKAYSIVEQGQIGLIVTSKPEERRKIIEEAAGISKFKARKEAALRKMEATQVNLTRLNDILTELSKQIASLDRQARKAEKFKQIRDELKSLEIELASFDYLEKNSKEKEQEGQLVSLIEQESVLAAELSQKEAAGETLRFQLAELENEISQNQEQAYSSENQIRLHEQAIQFKQREIQLFSDQELSLNQEKVNLSEQLEIEALQEEEEFNRLNDFEEKLLSLNNEYQTLVHASEEKQRSFQQKEHELKIAQQTIMNASLKHNQFHSKQENLSRQKLEIQSRFQQLSEELAELQSQLIEKEETLKFSKSDFEKVQQLQLGLTHHVENHQQNLKEKQSALETLQKEKLDLETLFTRAKSRLETLNKIEQNHEGFQESVRRFLNESQTSSLSSEIKSSLASLIDTAEPYQKALAAAMGIKLQSIVVNNLEASLKSIHFLKNAEIGRLSFIPSQLKKTEQSFSDLSHEQGVIGLLSHFVNIQGLDENSKNILFESVWLVENINVALKLFEENKSFQKLITLEGEVLEANGTLSGGSPEKEATALLERKQEIKDLEQQVGSCSLELNSKNQEIFILQDQVKNISQTLQTLNQDSQAETIRLANLQKDLSYSQNELLKLNEQIEKIKRQQSQEEQMLERVDSDMQNILEEISSLEISKLEQEAQFASIEQNLPELQQSYLNSQSALTELKFKRQALQEDHNRLKQENLSRLKNQERAKNRLVEISQLLISGTSKTEQLKQEIIESQELLKVLIVSLEEVKSSLQLHKQEAESLNNQIRQDDMLVKDLRRKFDAVKDELGGLRVSQTEIRNKLQQLKEQIFERYHEDLATLSQTYKEASLENAEEKHVKAKDLRERLEKIGSVNLDAIEEYETLKNRYDFLSQQSNDLQESLNSLNRVIQKINRSTKTRFQETFEAINQKFEDLFPKLFRGGRAKLLLTDENNMLETGVEIVAQPPGKKLQSISLLSGGEKALTAVSLIFSIFLCKPSPFCILDEVDAPLDDVNIDRFNELVKSMTDRSQFILITHSKRTMELADVLYGVTMQEAGVSKTVSVKLNEVAA